MSDESESRKTIKEVMGELEGLNGEIITAICRGAIEDIVSLWEDYKEIEEYGYHNPEEGRMGEYMRTTDNLRKKIFDSLKEHGMDKETLCPY